MDRFLVAVFPGEGRAREGVRALQALDAEGAITLYARAVIAVGEELGVTVQEGAEDGPLGTPVALLTGSLLGPLAGSVGIAVAAGAGTLGRVLHDLERIGIDEDFLTEVGDALSPGAAAVVAEVWEERISPVDARLAALGGRVLRRVRKEIADATIARDVAALQGELAELTAELGTVAEEHRAHLEERLDAVRLELRAAEQRATAALDALLDETEAKIGWLEARRAETSGERRARLEARAAELRSRMRQRAEKLFEARAAARRALG